MESVNKEFEIVFKESANKDLRKIQKHNLKSIIDKIYKLKSNPFPNGYIKLSGSKDIFRIRVGDYRIIYRVSTTSKIVYINYISHRKDVYR